MKVQKKYQESARYVVGNDRVCKLEVPKKYKKSTGKVLVRKKNQKPAYPPLPPCQKSDFDV